MKTQITLIIFLIINTFLIKGQFNVSIESSKTKTCRDTVITFTATATDGGVPVTNATFTWSFGDNSVVNSGFMLTSVNHSYSTHGGFIAKVVVSEGANSDYAQQKIEIGLKPNFSGTNSNREEPICMGQEIFLTGKSAIYTWKYKTQDTRIEAIPIEINNPLTFTSIFDYRIFNKAQAISSATDIDSVGIKLEHSDIRNLKIELKCPNNTSIILKDFGGNDKYFGEPIDVEGSNQTGVAYEYYWTNAAPNGTINSANPPGISIPSGRYTPEQSFALLAGCPLNGEWKIIVTDNQTIDNGYIISSELKFNKTLFPAPWEYSNTYTSPTWLGPQVSSTAAGLATAVPNSYGNHRYTFRLKDNYGCFQDTSFINSVEAVSFTSNPDPPTGPFDLDVEFSSTTSWATSLLWNFGDQSDEETSETITHTFTKDGKFKVLLAAETDDGCVDTTSVYAIITIPVSVFNDMPNTFSPNGDGQNDFLFLKEDNLDAIQTLDCWIYSRWGKKVAEWHSTEDALAGWDGTLNGGQKASDGVYFYYLKAVGYDGKVYEKKGSFHLFR